MSWKLFRNSSNSEVKPIFDPAEWEQRVQKMDWHREVPSVMDALNKLHNIDRELHRQTVDQMYDFFERQLRADRIALARTGENFDAERKPIDTIVIHHTSQKPGITADRISAIDLVRLYAPQYALKEPVRGVYSGHFRYGVQVFWPYHWLVRRDGRCERLLNDKETGWQAGDWEVNCRSVGIVLDGDYENSEPSEDELRAMTGLIKEHYPQVPRDRILGHLEVNKKTSCPSRLFLSRDGRVGWKDKLLAML